MGHIQTKHSVRREPEFFQIHVKRATEQRNPPRDKATESKHECLDLGHQLGPSSCSFAGGLIQIRLLLAAVEAIVHPWVFRGTLRANIHVLVATGMQMLSQPSFRVERRS